MQKFLLFTINDISSAHDNNLSHGNVGLSQLHKLTKLVSCLTLGNDYLKNVHLLLHIKQFQDGFYCHSKTKDKKKRLTP